METNRIKRRLKKEKKHVIYLAAERQEAGNRFNRTLRIKKTGGVMKNLIAIFAGFVFLTAVTGCMKVNTAGYDMSTKPHIINLPAQRMITAQANGTAEEISGKCISSLYQVYFSLKFKGKMMEAPRGRWPVMEGVPANQWTGIFGMPVSAEITSLPVLKQKLPVEVKLGSWDYGDTAEFLYIGSYDNEKPAVEALMKFIADSGYIINGMHEEIYIKGPGMFGKGNPAEYETIIRYPVKKAEVKNKNKK
jgi:hypothetical protein